MENSTMEKQSFVVQILNSQNATWQGTITWLDKNNTEHFRSLLELIKLIDSTMAMGRSETPEESVPISAGKAN